MISLAFTGAARAWRATAVAVLGLCAWSTVLAVPSVTTDIPHANVTFRALAPDASNKVLKVLVLGEYANLAHRKNALEFSLLSDYARAHGLQIDWLPVFRPEELYERLVRGEGALAVGVLPADIVSNPAIASTHPLTTWRYQLIGRKDTQAANPLALAGLKLGIRLSSPLWTYFERLQSALPTLQLEPLPSNLDRRAALQLVADGKYDATVLPSAIGEDDLADYPKLKGLFDLTDEQPAGWYVRSDQRILLRKLNRFIARYHAAYFEPVTVLRDFAAIKERGILRVATRVDPLNYFVESGRPAGYEYDLVTSFAQMQGLNIQLLTAKTDAQLVDWLKTGAADLISTRVASEYGRDRAVAVSRSYHYEPYVLIALRGAPLSDLNAMRGRRVAAYANSAAYRAATAAMRETGLEVIPAAPELSAETLLQRLRERQVAGLVLDAETAQRWVNKYHELALGASLPNQFEYRWLVRAGDAQLLGAVNKFFVTSRQDGLNATLLAKYLGPSRELSPPKPTARPRLSPFDPIIKAYAARYDFDWRLIAAQAYQESQFNPRAISPGGAVGLMQLLPATAKSMGFRNVQQPEVGIHAGVKYLYQLRNEFDGDVPQGERTWLALAAYNAGVKRVERARRLAREMNLDPNKWFGNVETAMLHYAQAQSRKSARSYGQAIIYVREIQSLYGTYLQLTDAGGRAGDLTLSSLTSISPNSFAALR